MSRFTAACLLALLLGCSGSAPNADLWTVYEGGVIPTHTSQGKPTVSGNVLTFKEWPTGTTMTISGKFKFHEAKTIPCHFCKKTIIAEAVQCIYCKKLLPEPK